MQRLLLILCLVGTLQAQAMLIGCALRVVHSVRRFLQGKQAYRVQHIPEAILEKLQSQLKKNRNDETYSTTGASFLYELDQMLGNNLLPDGTPRYRIESVLGSGGQGAVFQAHDVVYDREVGIKISGNDSRGPLSIGLTRQLQAKMRERNPLLTVFDYQRGPDWSITISEWLPEKDYSHLLKADMPIELRSGAVVGKVTPELALKHATILRNFALNLYTLHQNGFLFTDFKPGNASVLDGLSTKLMDLDSLAKMTPQGSVSLQRGRPLYTEGFGSPELEALWKETDPRKVPALAAKVTAKSDAFALGVTVATTVAYFRSHNFDPKDLVIEGTLRLLEKDVIAPLKQKDPAQRIGVEEAAKKLEIIMLALEKHLTEQ